MCVGIPGENILLSIVLAFRLDGRKRFEYSACGPVFVLANREKNILRFQKYLDACGYVIIFSRLMIDSVSIPGCRCARSTLHLGDEYRGPLSSEYSQFIWNVS